MPLDIWAALKAVPIVRSFLQSFVRWRGRPTLELFADAKPRRAVQTPLSVKLSPVEAVSKAIANYYRLQIRNRGRTTAKRCRAVITDIWYTDRSVWKHFAAWQAVPLIWSGMPGRTEIDLSPDQRE